MDAVAARARLPRRLGIAYVDIRVITRVDLVGADAAANAIAPRNGGLVWECCAGPQTPKVPKACEVWHDGRELTLGKESSRLYAIDYPDDSSGDCGATSRTS